MAIIKNASELSEIELENLNSLLIRYFREKYVGADTKYPHLCKIELFMKASGYAADTIKKIKEGYLTSLVLLNLDPLSECKDLIPEGFIMGYDTPAGMNNIIHLFLKEHSVQRSRRLDLLELFKMYIAEIRTHDMHRCQMSTSIFNPRLANDLETLSFEQTGITKTTLDYRLEFDKKRNAQSDHGYAL